MTPQWQSWDYTAYTSEFKASSDLPPSPSAHLAPRYFGQPPPARFPPGPARQPQGGEPMFSRASPFGDRLFSYPGFSETRHSPVDPLRETVCSSTPFAKHRVLQHVFGRTSRFPALLVQRTAVFQAPSLRLDWTPGVSWEWVVLEPRICRAIREIRRKLLQYKYAGPSKASRILRNFLRDSLRRRNFAPRRR